MLTDTRKDQLLQAARRALLESRKKSAEEDEFYSECDAELSCRNRQLTLLQQLTSTLDELNRFLSWISVSVPEESGADGDINRNSASRVEPPLSSSPSTSSTAALRCVAHVFRALLAKQLGSEDEGEEDVDGTWAYLTRLADTQGVCAAQQRTVARLEDTVKVLQRIPQQCRVGVEALEIALRALESAGETTTSLLAQRDREMEANAERVDHLKRLEEQLHSINIQANAAEASLKAQNESDASKIHISGNDGSKSGAGQETVGSLLSMQRLVDASSEIADVLKGIADAQRSLLPQGADDEPFTLSWDKMNGSVVVSNAHPDPHAGTSSTSSLACLTDFMRAFYARRRASEKCALLEKEQQELGRGLKKLDALVQLQNTLSLLASTQFQKDAAMAELAALPSPDAIRQLVLPSLRGQVHRLCEELDVRLSSLETSGERRPSQVDADGRKLGNRVSPQEQDGPQRVLEKQRERNAKLRSLLTIKKIDLACWENEEKPRHYMHIANLEHEHKNLEQKVLNLGTSLPEADGTRPPEQTHLEAAAEAAVPEVANISSDETGGTQSTASPSSPALVSAPLVDPGMIEVEVEILQGGTVRRMRIPIPAARPMLRSTAGPLPTTTNSNAQLQSQFAATQNRVHARGDGMPRFLPSKIITSVLRILAPGDPAPAKVERALQI